MGLKSAVKAIPVIGPALGNARRWVERDSPIATWLGKRRIMDRSDLHSFWRSPTPEGNVPADYLVKADRSVALLKLIEEMPKSIRILEIGCNVGRNLAYLHDAGYAHVEGVEISPHAVRLLRSSYPQLANAAIHTGAAEDVLPTLDTGAYDLVFTMAVLEHIHPDSATVVFQNMARLSKRILAIEPTSFHASIRQYPHDLNKAFIDLGFRRVLARAMWDIPETRSEPGMETYSAFMFVK